MDMVLLMAAVLFFLLAGAGLFVVGMNRRPPGTTAREFLSSSTGPGKAVGFIGLMLFLLGLLSIVAFLLVSAGLFVVG